MMVYIGLTSVQLYGQRSAVDEFLNNGTDFHGGANTSQPVYDESGSVIMITE